MYVKHQQLVKAGAIVDSFGIPHCVGARVNVP